MDFAKYSLKILNTLATPVLLIDRTHNILGANKAACSLFSMSIDNIVGKKCFNVVHKLDRECSYKGVRCPTNEALKLKRRIEIIHEHNYSGNTVFEHIIASPIFDDHDEVEFIIEEIKDITDLIQSKEIVKYLKRDIKTLQNLLPICSKCKKIRDDNGYWSQIESYISNHLDVHFSHGLCENCIEALYGKEDWYIAIEDKKKNKDKDT